MFTLSSYAFLYISISLPRCGESNLTTIDRNTDRQLDRTPTSCSKISWQK
jgi:hypothetical protein